MPASLDCTRSFELLSWLLVPQYISCQFSKKNSCYDSYFPIAGSVNSFHYSPPVRMTVIFFFKELLKDKKLRI